MLPGLLSSKTAMSVIEATDDLPVAPNTVYVIPAAEDMTIEQGILKLRSRPPSGQHLPVDSFLASLARDRKNQAVAVILSGTASDGAAGVEAVKREGGVTLAQDPSTAKYKGMPESAIATGAVDFVLPIPLLARQLSVIAEHPGADPVTGEQPPAPVHSVEDPILANARGAAFLAAVALGHLRVEEIPERIRVRRVFDPDPARSEERRVGEEGRSRWSPHH